jgi:hypothetical protein
MAASAADQAHTGQLTAVPEELQFGSDDALYSEEFELSSSGAGRSSGLCSPCESDWGSDC